MAHLNFILHGLWHHVLSDPLSTVAIILGVFGIWRAEHLFKKLDRNLQHLVHSMKNNILAEMLTVTNSYVAFTRALQVVELDPLELPKDAAFALLTRFHLNQLLHPNLAPQESAAFRKSARESVDTTARDYVRLLIDSGIGKRKEGVELIEPPGRSGN